ncbi:hypothetical protein ABE28_003250 [Peribacillus muralis]|uniref:Uncharacterized protein n=1 Tax=Peribacillus muralis TaxID=264697 RepID=A0A1B3XJF0_9BACI|nr:hypothetical protein [Peribacillus muralis]AOH53356.1 hypothetical protein ABE28_003250 [Peribacillus muralis]
MPLTGSVDIPFTNSTKVANDAVETAENSEVLAFEARNKAEAAQAAANTALTSANGKNTNYYDKSPPENPKGGDLWFKPSDDGSVTPLQFNGTTWLSVTDAIAQAAKDIVDSWTAPDGTSMNGAKIDGASISEEKMKWSTHLIF